VAKVTDAPVDHWKHAEAIPADILGRLSRAELRARCAYAAEHYRIAETAEPGHAGSLRAHARQVLGSIPVVDYIREQQRLNGRRRESAGRFELGDVYLQLRSLKGSNAFPPGLIAAVEAALLGRPSTTEAGEIVGRSRAAWDDRDGR
jgi:hypothetical protein